MDYNGPLFEPASLAGYSPSLKPSKAIWPCYDENNLRTLAAEVEEEILSRYLSPASSQQLMKWQIEICALWTGQVRLLESE